MKAGWKKQHTNEEKCHINNSSFELGLFRKRNSLNCSCCFDAFKILLLDFAIRFTRLILREYSCMMLKSILTKWNCRKGINTLVENDSIRNTISDDRIKKKRNSLKGNDKSRNWCVSSRKMLNTRSDVMTLFWNTHTKNNNEWNSMGFKWSINASGKKKAHCYRQRIIFELWLLLQIVCVCLCLCVALLNTAMDMGTSNKIFCFVPAQMRLM